MPMRERKENEKTKKISSVGSFFSLRPSEDEKRMSEGEKVEIIKKQLNVVNFP